MRVLVLACVAVTSLAIVPAAPGYDPWMWLLWGRELAGGSLETGDGPAFKPLPVAVCALLAPLGDAAPGAWLVLARAGALAAIALGAVLAYRLAPAGHARLAAAAGAAAVAFTGPLLALSAAGAIEGAFVALALAAVLAWREQRVAVALGLALCCALIRVEAIPFVAILAALSWRERPALRPWLAAGTIALPVAWLLPDAVSTGDVLRSAARARVPNPGQPALAAAPALESLTRATGLALAPVALGALALRRRPDPTPLLLAGVALAWLGLVAGMAQLGFSGEERYALPGVALLSVAGAVGLGRVGGMRPWLPWAVTVAVVLALVPRVSDLRAQGDRLAHAARLDSDLQRAVGLAGGRDALLACGRPVVGDYRGPLLAYRLSVPKPRVVFAAGRTGVAFSSRLSGERIAAPAVPPPYRALVRSGTWEVSARCASSRGYRFEEAG